MKISLEAVSARYQIRSYTDGFIVIHSSDNQQLTFDRHLLLTPQQLISDTVPRITQLTPEAIEQLRSMSVEILLLVDNNVDLLQQQAISQNLIQAGISAEWMQLGAACRCFNLLLSDGRKVGLLVNYPEECN